MNRSECRWGLIFELRPAGRSQPNGMVEFESGRRQI